MFCFSTPTPQVRHHIHTPCRIAPPRRTVGTMKPNESTTDRGIRGLVAVIAAALAFTVTEPGKPAGIALLVVAAIMGVTAAVGFCPIYRALGIGTRQ